MILHGHTPRDLLAFTIISIPKDMIASLCTSDNYRGILCSMLFVRCLIMYLCDDILYTAEMQFGFKQKHSTVVCSLIYKEVVSNYVQNGNNVYSCLLDASKACGRIHFGKLLAILIERNVSFCSYVLYWMRTHDSSLVCHEICVSKYFPVSNGVKQGGVLTPTLFSLSIYI